MKALCLVAHPDDCVIYGYSYIYNHPEMTWTVAYLTHQAQEPRGAELAQFWRRRNINVQFLGFADHWIDNEKGYLTRWCRSEAVAACQHIAQDYDLVLSHDQHGDYGHIHHRVVYDAVKDHARLVTFAQPGQGTVTYSVPEHAVDLEELPLHREVIRGFHPHGYTNNYKELQCI